MAGPARDNIIMTVRLSSQSHHTFLTVNWEDVLDEICRSNIIQRDNLKFIKVNYSRELMRKYIL